MIAQPAVPASTVAVTNTSGQTAYVTVAGGTVTSITVNGTQVATSTGYTAAVPAGGTIAVTYSAAPSWYWSPFTPALPASTVPLLNSTGQDITVIVLGGTVTHVNVNGTDRATSSPANVMVPNGMPVTLTYSSAPVWAWMNFVNLDLLDSQGAVYATGSSSSSMGAASLPYAAHAEGGMAGFGAGVSN